MNNQMNSTYHSMHVKSYALSFYLKEKNSPESGTGYDIKSISNQISQSSKVTWWSTRLWKVTEEQEDTVLWDAQNPLIQMVISKDDINTIFSFMTFNASIKDK